jgi:RND family efflux transporter MFP subunit
VTLFPRATVLVLAATLVACSDPPPPGKSSAAMPELETMVVEPAAVPRETAFDGVVEAINQATVSAQTSGRVMELPFDVGDYVEKDAVIVRFTTTEQRARSSAAEAALAEARARLSEAQLTHDRTKDLYDRKLVARDRLDRAEADLGSARARMDAAQAQLAEAREGLAYTVIRAPYAGIVVARHVQVGETVRPGQALMTGLSLEHLRVVVDIPQRHIGPLRKQRKARIILPDGVSVDAAELRMPPGADPATHSFRVLVTLPPGDHGVFPGTLVKVAFVTGEDKGLLVTSSAIARRGEVDGVYVIGDGGIEFRYLRLGIPLSDQRVPVLAGLVAGERVALAPEAAARAYQQSLIAGAR